MMEFVISLSISNNFKEEEYDSILVIVNRVIKIIYCELVKVTIKGLELTEVIFDMVVCYHRLSNLIITDRSLFFIFKFLLSLCYFLSIKQRVSTIFYIQINSKTKRENSTIETDFWAFNNFKQNDQARFLPIAKQTYNNAKNITNSHTSFKLNYSYYTQIS